MKIYLLDTGILSAYLHGRPRIVALVDPWVTQSEATTSILVYGEVIEYLKQRTVDYSQRHQRLHTLMTEIPPLPLNYLIMERYADIRRALRPPQGPGIIGDVDTLIAATALEAQLTLVTADSDFTRVSGLSTHIVDRSRLKA